MAKIRTTTITAVLCAVLAGVLAATPTRATSLPPPARTAAKTLTLESVRYEGAHRTNQAILDGYLALTPGAPFDPAEVESGIERLRTSGFFDRVDYYTRPGARRGAVVLVVELDEAGSQFRLGTGNSDLDGWYLIPAEACFDNFSGHGERAAIQLRFGYRLAGLYAHYLRGRNPHEKTLWGVRARVYSLEQVYFDDGVEYAQPTARAGVDLHWGRKLGGGLSLVGGLVTEVVDVDSTGSVWVDDEFAGVHEGDEVKFDQLPAAIAEAVGQYRRTALRADLVLDRRSPRRIAFTPESGLWGRLRVESLRQKTIEERDGERDDRFGSASLDLRAYRAWGPGVLALSARGAVTGSQAFFADRYYLGGLYTVRGFPSGALSAPGGDRSLWTGSIEYRAALAGPAARPRVAGSLFLDAGGSGQSGSSVAVGAGWGLRLRLFDEWSAGLDIAAPVTDTPVRESFHGHFSLGWRF